MSGRWEQRIEVALKVLFAVIVLVACLAIIRWQVGIISNCDGTVVRGQIGYVCIEDDQP